MANPNMANERNFLNQNSGTDALYDPLGGATNVGGGYYFLPGVSNLNVLSPLDAGSF